MFDTRIRIVIWVGGKWNGMVQLSWDTDPSMYFTSQCHVLHMFYQMNSGNYVTGIKGVMCKQAVVPSCQSLPGDHCLIDSCHRFLSVKNYSEVLFILSEDVDWQVYKYVCLYYMPCIQYKLCLGLVGCCAWNMCVCHCDWNGKPVWRLYLKMASKGSATQ